MIAYVRKFIFSCSKLITPLIENFDSKSSFHWIFVNNAACQRFNASTLNVVYD